MSTRAIGTSRAVATGATTVDQHRVAHARSGIACLSRSPNPYLHLLYSHLQELGYQPVPPPPRVTFGWLWSVRPRVGFLHFHWPEGHYRFERGPTAGRLPLSWVKLVLFGARLLAARTLRYRIVWTVHQVFPHETTSRRLDTAAARLLARLAHVLHVHDTATAGAVRDALPRSSAKLRLIPHGSYIGVYPQGRPPQDVRRALGIAPETFVFIAFGELRAYKNVDFLLEAFAGVNDRDVALIVAGPVKQPELAAAVENAAAGDGRIKPLLGYVPDDQVAELFGAADAAVVARSDGGTSGSLILALSLGRAVVAADTETYRSLAPDGPVGWSFRPGDPASLTAALEHAADDPAAAQMRGDSARAAAERLQWPQVAEQLAELLSEGRR